MLQPNQLQVEEGTKYLAGQALEAVAQEHRSVSGKMRIKVTYKARKALKNAPRTLTLGGIQWGLEKVPVVGDLASAGVGLFEDTVVQEVRDTYRIRRQVSYQSLSDEK